VIVSIDTCRADQLGCYGAAADVTPQLDALAREATLFENAISPVPITLPAHASMLTGTIPPYHGVHDNGDYRLAPDNVTLAELLRADGFATGAMVGAFVLDSQFGMDQGFDTYDDEFEAEFEEASITQRRAEEVSRRAIAWLQEHRHERFFLFLHYYDPHMRYDPPEPFRTRFADRAYAGEIAYTDHCIGEVIDTLKALDLYDSTLIIVTADHGEMLGEHGEQTHSYFVYQGALHVPLLIRVPGQQQPRRVAARVGLVDIVPTVLGSLGIEAEGVIQGTDLTPGLLGDDSTFSDRRLYCESIEPTKYGCNPLMGLVGASWKLILSNRSELYDLASDPAESNDLARSRPEQAVQLRVELSDRLQGSVVDRGRNEGLDAEARQRLRSLGYLSGVGATGALEIEPDREDAKDLIDYHELNMATPLAIDRGEHAAAERLIRDMLDLRPDLPNAYRRRAELELARDAPARAVEALRLAAELAPGDAEVRFELGRGLARLGAHSEAIPQYRRGLELAPTDVEGHVDLGISLRAVGEGEQALVHYRRALELEPQNVEACINLGNALVAGGDLDGAVAQYRRAVALAPHSADAHRNLGLALHRGGESSGAIEQLRRALQLDPDSATTHDALAGVLLARRDAEQALHHYRQAAALDPDSARLHNNLGNALQALGRGGEAAKHYRRALELDPDYPTAHFNLALVLRAQGELEQAILHLRRAVELAPGYTKAREHLDRALAERRNRGG
jgi:arylsulfatase A-like enzyme/Flp pilus assembly protein TadD